MHKITRSGFYYFSDKTGEVTLGGGALARRLLGEFKFITLRAGLGGPYTSARRLLGEVMLITVSGV